MSSHYVRTIVKNWMNQGTVPFYDTVNQDQDPGDAAWSTIDWGIPVRDLETYCGTTVEEGSFSVIFFGRPGVGEDILLPISEAEMGMLMKREDPAAKLTLVNRGAPIDFRQQEYFCLEYQVSYEFHS